MAIDDFIIDQDFQSYTKDEHEIWKILYIQQDRILEKRASNEFLRGKSNLNLVPNTIPNFKDLNKILSQATQWEIVAVEGLLPDIEFFELLSARKFPVTRWIRTRSQMDYIQEPDLFHDLYGHVPLLLNPFFADFMQMYGQKGMNALDNGYLKNLARLYWYTVEFGLVKTTEGLRISGSGIVSSPGESVHCLESNEPSRILFDLERVLQTDYYIDKYQGTYFVIESYEKLRDEVSQKLNDIYPTLTHEYAADVLLLTDKEFEMTETKCIPCEGFVLPMSSDEIMKQKPRLPDWTVGVKYKNEAMSVYYLLRCFKTKDWLESMVLLEKISFLAGSEGHHPDVEMGWGYVRVSLYTHAVKGLTENDFIMAEKIEKLL